MSNNKLIREYVKESLLIEAQLQENVFKDAVSWMKKKGAEAVNATKDFLSKFKNKQGIFQGWNKTYDALEGFADDPTKRSFQKVSGTVSEELDWFKRYTADYFTTVFSIEKTNSTGIKSDLVVMVPHGANIRCLNCCV